MAPLDLQGETLGERHRHYNELMKDALKQTSRPDKINPDDVDIENLMKIDIASNNKDLEYILEVLRSPDMLYVSRVLRNGDWLLQPQFAHVFNAENLHTTLLPTMTARAGNKLLLYIRLHLKDEIRSDQFYFYYELNNLKHAFKWLPYCSLSIAEHAVQKHRNTIDLQIVKRLCERSINILDAYVKSNRNHHKLNDLLKSTTFLLNTDLDKYLDIIESTRDKIWYGYGPTFNSKGTSLILKKSPQRILNRFENYVRLVDLKTVARYIKPEDIKDFLVRQMANKTVKQVFDYEKLKYFVRRMPKEGRFEFIKKVFIDKDELKETRTEDYSDKCELQIMQCTAMVRKVGMSNTSSANIYNWYRFALFETAFPDLKKLIRAESSPVERNAILGVLLICAGRNPKHIHDLLKFYQECHINEPFKFKIHFINQVISKTDTHRYDSETWDILNKIFHSMEVYIESENNVSSCIESIIVYQTLRNEEIPEIVQKKFNFCTLKSLQIKLSPEESEKVFSFLYTYLETKLLSQNLSDKEELTVAIELFDSLRNLIVEWKRKLAHFPLLEAKAIDLVKAITGQGWTKDFIWIYEKDNWWRRQLFAQSVVLRPSEETLLNILKHKPAVLEQYREAVQRMCCDDNITMSKLLAKLRVYWPQTWARDWIAAYRARQTTAGGHRALVRGLCALLPPTELIDLLRHYAPQNTKIEWATENEIELSLRKNMALNMHWARPQPPLEVALLYARGDYLQFVIPALSALMYNLSVEEVREVLPNLLNAPVSLRKHGLRLAFAKLPSHELKPIFSHIWDTTKNPSIRAVLFNQTFHLLCRENKTDLIQELWELLSLFIDNLSTEENKEIYPTFSKIGDVPIDVRAKFCMKSYRFLKSLPAKANCEDVVNVVINHTRDIMEKLDYDFVINDVMPYVTGKLGTDSWRCFPTIISAFLLSATDEQSQMLRYNTVLVPLLRNAFDQWDENYRDGTIHSFCDVIKWLLIDLCRDVTAYVLKKGMFIPVKLFGDIQKEIEEHLPVDRNYNILRRWKLTAYFVKIFEQYRPELPTTKNDEDKSGCDYRREESESSETQLNHQMELGFSKGCLQYLKDDLNQYFPSVYLLFGDALENVIDELQVSEATRIEILKGMLSEEFIPSYLTVLQAMPYYLAKEEKWKQIHDIITSHPSLEVKIHYYKKFQQST